jgi:hypothetical protein
LQMTDKLLPLFVLLLLLLPIFWLQAQQHNM